MVASAIRGDRRRHDDRAVFCHRRDRCVQREQPTQEIHVHDPSQLVDRSGGELLVIVLHRGVLDEDVDTAAGEVSRLLDEFPCLPLVREVARYCQTAPGLRFDGALGVLRITMLVQVADDDIGPLGREEGGDRSPDPAVTSGDHRRPILQQSGGPPVGVAVFGTRRHLALDGGHPILALLGKRGLLHVITLTGRLLLAAYRLGQLLLAHPGAACDVQVAGPVVEFVAGVSEVVDAAIGLAAALFRPGVRGAFSFFGFPAIAYLFVCVLERGERGLMRASAFAVLLDRAVVRFDPGVLSLLRRSGDRRGHLFYTGHVRRLLSIRIRVLYPYQADKAGR
jgi:hypothetical protein